MNQGRESRALRYIDSTLDKIAAAKPISKKEFLADPMMQAAFTYWLQAISDTVKTRVSDEFKLAHPGIDWKAVVGFRNIAAHQYDGLDLDAVWEIVEAHLGELRDSLRETD